MSGLEAAMRRYLAELEEGIERDEAGTIELQRFIPASEVAGRLAEILADKCQSKRPSWMPGEPVQCILDREHAGLHIASGGEWSDRFAFGLSPRCDEFIAGQRCALLPGHDAAHARYEREVLVRW